MPKPILKHQTADGVVHTRQTARTYTHVIVCRGKSGKDYVTNWVGRPDLVAGALSQARKFAEAADAYTAEPINGGTRAEPLDQSIMTSAAEYLVKCPAGDLESAVTSDVRLAGRWIKSEALQVLAIVKSKYDNGAELFTNPRA